MFENGVGGKEELAKLSGSSAHHVRLALKAHIRQLMDTAFYRTSDLKAQKQATRGL